MSVRDSRTFSGHEEHEGDTKDHEDPCSPFHDNGTCHAVRFRSLSGSRAFQFIQSVLTEERRQVDYDRNRHEFQAWDSQYDGTSRKERDLNRGPHGSLLRSDR